MTYDRTQQQAHVVSMAYAPHLAARAWSRVRVFEDLVLHRLWRSRTDVMIISGMFALNCNSTTSQYCGYVCVHTYVYAPHSRARHGTFVMVAQLGLVRFGGLYSEKSTVSVRVSVGMFYGYIGVLTLSCQDSMQIIEISRPMHNVFYTCF